MTDTITDLKIELTDLEPCVKKITIEVPTSNVTDGEENMYKDLVKTVNIPGFRKGRAPRRVIEKMYGEKVRADVTQRLVQDAYRQALKTNEINPIGDPMIDDLKFDAGAPISFTATVEIFPEVELGDLASISLVRKVAKITDDSINTALMRYREQQARYEPVEGRDNVLEDDYIVIDYSAKNEDGTAVDNFTGEGRQVRVVKNELFAGFHDGILGLTKGIKGQFDADLPNDFPEASLAGQKLSFEVLVNEIKEKVLPEMDDQLAQEVSEFDTLDELKNHIREGIENRNREMANHSLRDDLINKLIDEHQIDLPPGLVEDQVNAIAKRAEENRKNQEQGGEPALDPERTRATAIRGLKEQVILTSFGKKEKIEVTDQDIDNEVTKIAGMMQLPVETAKGFLTQGDSMVKLTNQAFTEKVFTILFSKIDITDQTVEELDE